MNITLHPGLLCVGRGAGFLDSSRKIECVLGAIFDLRSPTQQRQLGNR